MAACVNTNDAKSRNEAMPCTEHKDASFTVNLHFAQRAWSKNADTLFLRFRITDNRNNQKVFWDDLSKEDFEIKEDGKGSPFKDIIIKKIASKPGTRTESISQNIGFWFVVDRGKTISTADMESMKDAIQQTVETLPEGSAFISFFGKKATEIKMITKNNFHEFENEFTVKQEIRDLYGSIINYFEKIAKDETTHKMDAKCLLIFTDGTINLSSIEEIDKLDESQEYFKLIDNTYQNKIQIHAFRYGVASSLNDKVLSDLCLNRQNPELIGNFYPASNIAEIIESLRGFVDNFSADYELILVNPHDKIYNGAKLSLQVMLLKDNEKAAGGIVYAIASKEKPLGPGIKSDDTYIAIIIGVFILFIAFFFMLVVIPYFISRTSNFEKKYVKPYETIHTEEGEVHEACSFCQEPLEKGDLIVVKCPHKIHWECWKENGYKCVEYGQNCKEGIQYHYDNKHPFDLKRSPYYLKWAMSGMISGLLIWIVFHLSSGLQLFHSFIDRLLHVFYPTRLKESIEGALQISNDARSTFQAKIAGLLLAGILLGFILTFLFSYLNDYRQKKAGVIFSIFARSLIGAVVGFLTFLIGAILCILLGKYSNVAWLDGISWLLFGGLIALTISIKTTIKWQDALIGGLISGVVSFLILYSTYFLPSFGVMFGFMFCSAGLGVSIIARHTLAQKYYLKYKGTKREGLIAIHKWMNDSGGSNEVTIGKSNRCIIQMNWDDSENIADMQVKLYIDPKRRIPMLKVIESGIIYDGRDGRKDELHILRPNVRFKIGNTDFQYIEK
jgi:MFS family permease